MLYVLLLKWCDNDHVIKVIIALKKGSDKPQGGLQRLDTTQLKVEIEGGRLLLLSILTFFQRQSGLTAVALKVGIFLGILESKSRAMSNMLDGVTEEV
jgi:hypothetical protein